MRLNKDTYVVKTINTTLITNFYEKVDNSFLIKYDIKSLTWDYCKDTNLIVVIKNDNNAYCFETPKELFYVSGKKTVYNKINEIVDMLIEYIKKRGK